MRTNGKEELTTIIQVTEMETQYMGQNGCRWGWRGNKFSNKSLEFELWSIELEVSSRSLNLPVRTNERNCHHPGWEG